MSQTQNLQALVARFPKTKILVVGDLILDRFITGSVDRISPESPVPVLVENKAASMLGGAGNVLANLCGLGAQATLIAVTGDDSDAELVAKLCGDTGTSADSLVRDASRPTIVKTRFLAGHQQLLRVDAEKTASLSPAIETALLERITAHLPTAQAVILSDYGKGVLTPPVIRSVIEQSTRLGIPVLVDPKGADYSRYRGADVVTPNRKELAEATAGLPTKTDSEIETAATQLLATSGIKSVVATRSQDGMTVLAPGAAPLHLTTRALEVFDVSGAGDTVIATIAAALAAGAPLADAAHLANLAGGIVVAKVGTAAIRAKDLTDALTEAALPLVGQAPLHTWDAAREQVKRWQAKGLRVGFTNGCFDILHAGHVTYLNQARSLCDRLVLGLNHDASVRILKGPTRPVNTEGDRATVIGGLGAIDLVVLFGATTAGSDNTPCDLIASLQPDIFFKGGDYTLEQLPEAKVVQAYGGEVRVMGLVDGLSTTNTIRKLAETKVA